MQSWANTGAVCSADWTHGEDQQILTRGGHLRLTVTSSRSSVWATTSSALSTTGSLAVLKIQENDFVCSLGRWFF